MAAKSLCSIPGCGKAIHSRDLCPAHYRKWRLYGDPLGGKPPYDPNATCSFEGCENPVSARGWCSTHYSRWLTNGDVSITHKPANGTLPAWLVQHSDWTGDDCLIWPFSRMPSGYACVAVVDGIKAYAHRHMCRLAHGEPPDVDMDTAHSCGNGHLGCVNPRHLRWATRVENMDDMIGHGRTNRGEKSPTSKLTADQVREIRRLSGTMPQRAIAKRFGTSQGNVTNIVLRKRWAWLD